MHHLGALTGPPARARPHRGYALAQQAVAYAVKHLRPQLADLNSAILVHSAYVLAWQTCCSGRWLPARSMVSRREVSPPALRTHRLCCCTTYKLTPGDPVNSAVSMKSQQQTQVERTLQLQLERRSRPLAVVRTDNANKERDVMQYRNSLDLNLCLSLLHL